MHFHCAIYVPVMQRCRVYLDIFVYSEIIRKYSGINVQRTLRIGKTRFFFIHDDEMTLVLHLHSCYRTDSRFHLPLRWKLFTHTHTHTYGINIPF